MQSSFLNVKVQSGTSVAWSCAHIPPKTATLGMSQHTALLQVRLGPGDNINLTWELYVQFFLYILQIQVCLKEAQFSFVTKKKKKKQ